MKQFKEPIIDLQDFELELQDFELDLIHELKEVGLTENEYYGLIFKTNKGDTNG